jgi:23S rRNA (uracil1939-C5)-methyltransferase
MTALPKPESNVVRELSIEAVVAGGFGLARHPDDGVVLVAGALPGEVVEARITSNQRGVRRAHITDVRVSAPSRRVPPCPNVDLGCGGCDWQHVKPIDALALKRSIAVDALSRIGRLGREAADGLVDASVVSVPVVGYRTTLRCTVDSAGRLALRQLSSRNAIAIDGCSVAHVGLQELLRTGRFALNQGRGRPLKDQLDVIIRHGTADGRTVVGLPPSTRAIELPLSVDAIAIGNDPGVVREHGGSAILQVSLASFFQSGPAAAAVLTTAAAELIDIGLASRTDAATIGDVALFDLYGGIGLFACALGASRATIVESNPAAALDAVNNLSMTATRGVVIEAEVERWRPDDTAGQPAGGSRQPTVVIADPARSGLGPNGVATIDAIHPDVVVLVSCDPAAGARDVANLTATGLRPITARVCDLFPETHHLELLTLLVRH